MEIERQAAAGLKWNAAAKLLSQAFSWTVTLIVVRLLSPEDYGLMAIATVVISVLAGVAEFGLGASLIQAQSLQRDELPRIAGALAVFNIACGIVLALSAPAIAYLFEEPRLRLLVQVLSLQFVFLAIDTVPSSLMQRQMDFKLNARIEFAVAIVSSVTTVTLAWLTFGVWALVIGTLAGAATRTCLLLLFGTVVVPSFRLTGIRSHIRFGGFVTLSRFLWQVTHQLDTLIAGRYLTRESLGLYTVAMHLATLPMTKAMAIVNQVAFPAVARLQHESPRLRLRLLEAIRLLAATAIPCLWGLSAVAREFVEVVLGARWHAAVLALQLVSVAAPARMLIAVLSTAAAASGRADLEVRNTLVSAVILPVAFLIGVQAHLNGLAASWLVAVPVILALVLPRTCRALGLTLRDVFASVRAPLLAGAVMYGTVSVSRVMLSNLDEPARLPILIALGAATYLGLVNVIDRTIWTDAKRFVHALRG